MSAPTVATATRIYPAFHEGFVKRKSGIRLILDEFPQEISVAVRGSGRWHQVMGTTTLHLMFVVNALHNSEKPKVPIKEDYYQPIEFTSFVFRNVPIYIYIKATIIEVCEII
jgi:hypothetical protein